MSLKKLLFLLLVLSAGYGANAQEKIAPEQLRRIIVIKARCLDNNKADYYYYIQIYNGKNLQTAKRMLKQYLNNHPNSKAFIKWENPEYKVWTGQYEDILDVERAMLVLRKEYPNALIVYPKVR